LLEGLLTRKCRLAKYLLICFLCLVAPVGALKASKAYECTSCWATHPCHFRFIYSCKHSHKQCSFKYHKFLNCIQLVFNLLENPAMINWTKSGKTVIDLNQQCYPNKVGLVLPSLVLMLGAHRPFDDNTLNWIWTFQYVNTILNFMHCWKSNANKCDLTLLTPRDIYSFSCS
jgi:hypothetical protein